MTQDELQFFIIDDDIDDHAFFIHALKKTGTLFTCKTATDGEKGLAFLKMNNLYIPDFIFLDLNMPKVNGKQFLMEFMKIEKLYTVPIYIYTTSSSEEDKRDTLQMGATGFITKPTALNELVSILSEIVAPYRKPF